jgi:hypothetical protein
METNWTDRVRNEEVLQTVKVERNIVHTIKRRKANWIGRGGTSSNPDRSMWDLWWAKWHWDKFFSEYFGFPLSISFHRCSIKVEKQKTPHNLHHRVAQ